MDGFESKSPKKQATYRERETRNANSKDVLCLVAKKVQKEKPKKGKYEELKDIQLLHDETICSEYTNKKSLKQGKEIKNKNAMLLVVGQ